jgi:ATP-independent RNA helicase DbpA
MQDTSFSTLSELDPATLATLQSLGYTTMTPVQARALPVLFGGSDAIVQAETGSGKTIAFGLPLVEAIDTAKSAPQALVLAPTRELAEQIAGVLRSLARHKANLKVITLCGGAPLRPQVASLERGAHILVGTPGRIEDHLFRKTLPLGGINRFVLDEADRMLDMGFYDVIEKIAAALPPQRQSVLFSATYPESIRELSRTVLRQPETIRVEPNEGEGRVEEWKLGYASGRKEETLLRLLRSYRPESAILFCNTRAQAAQLAAFLRREGVAALDLHADLDQRRRHERLLMFANASARVLVATDIASRGIDVARVSMIVNYELPHERKLYIHRIGRTARAGAGGMAVSLVSRNEAEKCASLMPDAKELESAALEVRKGVTLEASNVTLCIDGGRKQKLRPGDIVGALGKGVGIAQEVIGEIALFDRLSYVAIDAQSAEKAFVGLKKEKIKGRKFRVWRLDPTT